MKSLIKATVVVATLAVSASVFAQSNNTRITREQVRAEIVELQQAGYHVGDGDQAHYPAAIQAAEARIAAKHAQDTAYGGSAAGSSQSGSAAVSLGGTGHVSAADWREMYSR